jgi:uncharacterized protein YecE (DUF72 family)
LRTWAGKIDGFRPSGRDVFVYFNNDDAGHAVANARELRGLLGPEDGHPAPPRRTTSSRARPAKP